MEHFVLDGQFRNAEQTCLYSTVLHRDSSAGAAERQAGAEQGVSGGVSAYPGRAGRGPGRGSPAGTRSGGCQGCSHTAGCSGTGATPSGTRQHLRHTARDSHSSATSLRGEGAAAAPSLQGQAGWGLEQPGVAGVDDEG